MKPNQNHTNIALVVLCTHLHSPAVLTPNTYVPSLRDDRAGASHLQELGIT